MTRSGWNLAARSILRAAVLDTDDIAAMTRGAAAELSDTKLDVKVVLSGLWIAMLFVFAYVDIFAFWRADVIEGALAGKVPGAGFEIGQTFLALCTIYILIPSLMIVVSLLAPARLNRAVNIAVACSMRCQWSWPPSARRGSTTSWGVPSRSFSSSSLRASPGLGRRALQWHTGPGRMRNAITQGRHSITDWENSRVNGYHKWLMSSSRRPARVGEILSSIPELPCEVTLHRLPRRIHRLGLGAHPLRLPRREGAPLQFSAHGSELQPHAAGLLRPQA